MLDADITKKYDEHNDTAVRLDQEEADDVLFVAIQYGLIDTHLTFYWHSLDGLCPKWSKALQGWSPSGPWILIVT
jgi:hypothetical protein